MKAVGVTNKDVLELSWGEAAGIGFIGGLGEVILGWFAGQVIDGFALSYLTGQSAQQGGSPPRTAVYVPFRLPIFALILATLIGLISSLYSVLRVAMMVPICASKYK
jgi:ABC-type antimicrobial peptide transport system permease subunit